MANWLVPNKSAESLLAPLSYAIGTSRSLMITQSRLGTTVPNSGGWRITWTVIRP